MNLHPFSCFLASTCSTDLWVALLVLAPVGVTLLYQLIREVRRRQQQREALVASKVRARALLKNLAHTLSPQHGEGPYRIQNGHDGFEDLILEGEATPYLFSYFIRGTILGLPTELHSINGTSAALHVSLSVPSMPDEKLGISNALTGRAQEDYALGLAFRFAQQKHKALCYWGPLQNRSTHPFNNALVDHLITWVTPHYYPIRVVHDRITLRFNGNKTDIVQAVAHAKERLAEGLRFELFQRP